MVKEHLLQLLLQILDFDLLALFVLANDEVRDLLEHLLRRLFLPIGDVLLLLQVELGQKRSCFCELLFDFPIFH